MLVPNNPEHDNGPEIQEMLNEGRVVDLPPYPVSAESNLGYATAYYTSPVRVEEGASGSIQGYFGGYRNVNRVTTIIAPIPDWDGTEPLISFGVDTPSRFSTKLCYVRDVCFKDLHGRKRGDAVVVESGVQFNIERCSFFDFVNGVRYQPGPGEGTHTCAVRDCNFYKCGTGLRFGGEPGAHTHCNYSIECCSCMENAVGIQMRHANIWSIRNSLMEANTKYGVYVLGGVGSIADCYFEKNQMWNLWVGDGGFVRQYGVVNNSGPNTVFAQASSKSRVVPMMTH